MSNENTNVTPKETNTPKELNMDQKITVRNIAGWTVGFSRIETNGDVTIPPEGTVRLARSEIIAQAQNGNRLFNGIDFRGGHATLYIEDEATRIELEYDSKSEKRTQQILTEDVVKKLFEYKTMKTFEEKLRETVVTRAEKYAIVRMIIRMKINDHDKIRAVENYTGYKI